MKPTTRRERVTLADVAQRAGVSVTTASFVLSGRTDMRISMGTADRVLQSARVLHYVAKGDRKRQAEQTEVIGFISSTVASEPFAVGLIRGASKAASQAGHSVVVAESEGDHELEARLVRDLLSRGVNRFMYATTGTIDVKLPKSLKSQKCILLNCADPHAGLPTLLPDDEGAGTLAVETLLSAGHATRIWLVGEVTDVRAPMKRLAGIEAGLAAHGLELENHIECPWWPQDARAAVSAALACAPHPPTAIIAVNDRAAMGVYQAAAAAGLRIPDDLSVVSFDNSDLSWWLYPELTSIEIPYFNMGRRAVEMVLNGAVDPTPEFMEMRLHERDSIAAPRG